MKKSTFVILLVAIFALLESCERQDSKIFKLTDAISEAIREDDATDYEQARLMCDRLYQDAPNLSPTNAVVLIHTYILLHNYHLSHNLTAEAQTDCDKAIAVYDIARKNDVVTVNRLCKRYFKESNIPATIERFRESKIADAKLNNR